MLTYLTAGESHGPQLTAVIDGLPAGLAVEVDQINFELARRQKGYGRGGRMAIEKDAVEVVSGLRGGRALGGPITLVIKNKDWINWTETMDPVDPAVLESNTGETSKPRPGHADLAGGIKYNHHDLRNVLERASARETTARVALGALARQLLGYFNIEIASHVVQVGTVALQSQLEIENLSILRDVTEKSPVRCLDSEIEAAMIGEIDAANQDQDTLGGVAEIIIRSLPVGLGGLSQASDRLEGKLAAAMMSIPSVKGVEIGLGFEAAARRGSEVHDEIFYDPYGDAVKKCFHRETNRAGGIEGGITNGEDVVIRVAAKPISTLRKPLNTVDVNTKESAEALVERSDVCIVPALAVIGEAMAALVLADAFLEKFGADNIAETERNYNSYLKANY